MSSGHTVAGTPGSQRVSAGPRSSEYDEPVFGVPQLCAAIGVWARSARARWTGVAIAGLSGIAQLLFLPADPWVALAVLTIDLLVIYGLVSYGGRPEEA
jgi:hypothetical protein